MTVVRANAPAAFSRFRGLAPELIPSKPPPPPGTPVTIGIAPGGAVLAGAPASASMVITITVTLAGDASVMVTA